MTTPPSTLTIPGRYCGPPDSGNGGWCSGALADLVTTTGLADGAVTVSLRLPPPLDQPLDVAERDGWLVATVDDRDVLMAHPAEAEPHQVPGVPAATARAAEASYAGLAEHVFNHCFGCGPGRDDGLRIFPGEVDAIDGATRIAATWTPTEVDGPTVWTALDCIGGWTAPDQVEVLGSMTARVHRMPAVGETHVVVGLDRGRERRKRFASTSLYDAAGDLVATADQIWIAVDGEALAAGGAR